MGANLPEKSVSNWAPGNAGGVDKANAVEDKLNRPNAHDAKDTMTGTNELKPFVGGKGTPSGPFGQRGQEF